ncbi:interleukin-8-like [Triplophysa rosa]|uniref:Chemokine interleukin-8-like domain-containing protein n=1 Tax=Triplophysa rosa TaxID=992332 RepID=A0A9W7X511_TRIRA|nr:interleukin-8-like [Triplophysa rosa]KAI7813860.1 hypothetical protein IRJ41_003111 [Triplophysa rosa]
MNTFTVAAVTFLICMTLLSTSEGRPPLRCQCVGSYLGKPISIDKVDSIKTFAAGPHCKNVEIIAIVKHKNNKSTTTCLNPSDAWVKSLMEEWNKKSNSIIGSMNKKTT